jgi:hypothetical protein
VQGILRVITSPMELKTQPTIHLHSKPGYCPRPYPDLPCKWIVGAFLIPSGSLSLVKYPAFPDCFKIIASGMQPTLHLKLISTTEFVTTRTNVTNMFYLKTFRAFKKTDFQNQCIKNRKRGPSRWSSPDAVPMLRTEPHAFV